MFFLPCSSAHLCFPPPCKFLFYYDLTDPILISWKEILIVFKQKNAYLLKRLAMENEVTVDLAKCKVLGGMLLSIQI